MQINYKKFIEYDNHKKIIQFEDKKNNLKGFIAIHNNNLGSAVGGTRFFPYRNQEEALKDVLRLSKAMTYKCALAGVKYGGGKAVIIGNPRKIKNDKLLVSYASQINKLQGNFSTGEDVGISEQDVQVMLKTSPYFIGRKGFAGDPSPFASLSTFYAMKSASKFVFGKKSLEGRTIAVKGVGKVGSELVRLLLKENALVFVADIDKKVTSELKKAFPAIKVVSPEKIHTLKVDIYAPCAMGNEFTNNNKKLIKARIICGAANNQLNSNEIGDWFFENGILYVPDYVANAGGLINVVDEMEPGGYSKKRVDKRIKKIDDTVRKIIELSEKKKISTVRIANDIAEKKLKSKK